MSWIHCCNLQSLGDSWMAILSPSVTGFDDTFFPWFKLSSGKTLRTNYGKSPFAMRKLARLVIFISYIQLPEGIQSTTISHWGKGKSTVISNCNGNPIKNIHFGNQTLAIENGPFIVGFPIKTHYIWGSSTAMFDDTRGLYIILLEVVGEKEGQLWQLKSWSSRIQQIICFVVHWANCYSIKLHYVIEYTLWLFEIAMGNSPSIDDL